MLSSSASRLSKSYVCGKMAQLNLTQNLAKQWIEVSNSSSSQEDGNLRHALMEFYLNNIALNDLTLDSKKMREMAKGENWMILREFLEEKGTHTALGNICQINCRKALKKLRKVLDHLSKLLHRYGELVHIGSEISLDIGEPIIISDSIQIERGEIDAVFVLKNNLEQLTVFVIDWKRGLSNSNTLIQYKCQVQTYIRCLQKKPDLINLDPSTIDVSFKGYLIEIGGKEGTKSEIVEVNTDTESIDNFLSKAVAQYESNVATPGPHCSSWCKWAFNEPCMSITPESLSINFHSDSFWTDLRYQNKPIYNTLVQFNTELLTTLEQGGRNIILFNNNRELHLKDINFSAEIERNRIVRIEGNVIRKTPNQAHLYVKHFSLI